MVAHKTENVCKKLRIRHNSQQVNIYPQQS